MNDVCIRCKMNDQVGPHLMCETCEHLERAKLWNALGEFSAVMNERLHEKLREGFTGWDGEYDIDDLVHETLVDAKEMFNEQNPKNAVDIANRCMFIWLRSKQ